MSHAIPAKSCLTLRLGNYRSFLEQVKHNPSQAEFSFSATTIWQRDAQPATPAREQVITTASSMEQPRLAAPVELLLAALTSCVSVGMIAEATKRGVDFEDFEIEVLGDLDLRGHHGLDPHVRPGYTSLEYVVRVKSAAPREVIAELLRSAEQASPLFDNMRHGLPITSRLEIIA